jgi:hypothetical protein
MELTPEDKLILCCIKVDPNAVEIAQMNNLISQITDWDSFAKTIVDRGIAPLLYRKLPLLTSSSMIPSTVGVKLQQAYYITLTRSMMLYDYFRKVANALNSADILFIALKGIYLSEWLYKDIGLRQMSDIDLLVKPEDGEKCLAVLSELGFVSVKNENVSDFIEKKSNRVHYAPMILNDVSVEVHTKLHRDGETYSVRPVLCWQAAVQATINKADVYVLSPADLLIHLAVHLDKHFCEGHVQFTCFNDITNLLAIYSGSFDWSAFVERCRVFNCESAVMKYLILVHKYCNGSLPETIVESYSSLLTVSDDELFVKYLHGYKFEIEVKTAIPAHLNNLKNLHTLSDFTNYLADLIFPPKKFMLEKYHIKHAKLFPLYYPYRYFMGVKGLFYMLAKRSKR